jgi:hypothetical protein
MSDILVNDVLSPTTERAPIAGLHRVLHIDRDRDLIVLFRLKAPYGQPKSEKFSAIDAAYHNLDIVRGQFQLPALMLKLDEVLPESKRLLRDRKWEQLKGLLNRKNRLDLLFEETRGPLVDRYAEEHGLHAPNIYRDLAKFYLYGSTKNAFLPQYFRCGAPGTKRKSSVTRGRWRKRLAGQEIVKLQPYQITAEDKANFEKAYMEYIRNEDLSISGAFGKMISNFYNLGWRLNEKGGSEPILGDPDKSPSERQFRYWLRTTHDELDTRRKRLGEKRWAKDHRPLYGSTQQETSGSADRFQIDATIFPAYLANSFNRGWTLKKPIVYYTVDCFSDLITGIHVATEGPNWNTARLALFNSFTDKVEFCARYGVTIKPEEWPAHHLPNKLLPDRGELMCESVDGMVDGLNIIMEYPQSYRGDLKGLVESRILIIQGMIFPRMPGKVSKKRKPGAQKPPLGSALTLDEFTKIVIEAVLHYNKHAERPRLRTAPMIADNVVPTPLHIWNWGLKNGTGSPHSEPPEKIYSFLLPRGTATICKDGIAFNGARYTCARAVSERWFERARADGTKSLEIRYHPGTSNFILILNDRTGQFDMAHLIDADERYKNRRYEEIFQFHERDKLEAVQREQERRQGAARLFASQSQIFKSAKAATRESRKGLSKTAITRDMRENSALEAQAERMKDVQRVKSYLSAGTAQQSPKRDSAGQRARAKVIELLQKRPRS